MKYEVLYHRDAPWRVGETKAERVERMRSRTPLATADRYPNCYPGQVISIRALCDVAQGRLPSLSNMADKDNIVVVLDLDKKGREALAGRGRKIVAGRPERVTFEDRHGATAQTLRAQFADAEAAEAKAEDRFDMDGRRFVEVSALARGFLDPTVTNTGTGNYFTKETPTQLDRTQSGAPAGQTVAFTAGGLGTADGFIGGYITNVTRGETRAIVSHVDDRAVLEGSLTNWLDTDDLDIFDAWSTIQAAIDQLFTDQGATNFSSTQTIDIFDGTYTEIVTLNGSLRPTLEWRLQIKAATGQTAVTMTNTALADHVLNLSSVDCIYVADLTITSVEAGKTCIQGTFCRGSELDNCTLNTASGGIGLNGFPDSYIHDSVVTGPGTGFINCRGTRFYKVDISNDGVGIQYNVGAPSINVSSCTFAGCSQGIAVSVASPVSPRSFTYVFNCTFHDCTFGIRNVDGDGDDVWMLVGGNNIFSTTTGSDYALHNPGIMGVVEWDANIYFGYTNPFHLGGSDLSLSEWQAEVDRAGNSPDPSSIDTDPLLTDPGNGDFSLATGSPALNAGHGSGVVTGINDVAFDKYHPDIGAWSSGTFTVPAPTISAVVDDGTGTSATATIDADNELDEIFLRYRLRLPDAEDWTLFGSTRTGDGDLQITGLTTTKYGVIAVAKRNGVFSLPSNEVLVDVTNGESTTLYPTDAVWSLLHTNATVAALVGGRIFPAGDASQDAALPYMVYQRISTPSGHHMSAASNAQEIRVQTTVWAKTVGGAQEGATAVRNALDGFGGTVTYDGNALSVTSIRLDDQDDTPEPPTDGSANAPAGITQDWLVWYAQTTPSFS